MFGNKFGSVLLAAGLAALSSTAQAQYQQYRQRPSQSQQYQTRPSQSQQYQSSQPTTT